MNPEKKRVLREVYQPPESSVGIDEIQFPSSFEIKKKPDASGTAEFTYLDQDAVLQADVLDMRRAVDVMAEVLCLFETDQCRQPPKVVLRDGDNAACEARGRINGLFALIGGNVRAMGMKWIASFPANRERKPAVTSSGASAE